MKLNNLYLIVFLSMVVILSGCVSRKKLTYLQFSGRTEDYDNSVNDFRNLVTPSDYRIMQNDNLFIRVITPDPQWSALFNSEVGSSGLTQESAGLAGYSVDLEGYIELPYLGSVMASGKTISELKADLDSIFKNYVTDAALTVKLVNNAVSIIGEVNNPGRYMLYKDRINIFEAISIAGDISSFGNRQKVQLIRPSPYGPIIKEFSLTDRSILTSEYYYIMPNDIIYVVPTKGRSFQLNTSIYSLLLTTLTTALVVLSYFQRL